MKDRHEKKRNGIGLELRPLYAPSRYGGAILNALHNVISFTYSSRNIQSEMYSMFSQASHIEPDFFSWTHTDWMSHMGYKDGIFKIKLKICLVI